MPIYTTYLTVSVPGAERELELEIHYRTHKGFKGDHTDPPEEPSVEIEDAFVVWSRDLPDGTSRNERDDAQPWLFDMLTENLEIQEELFADATATWEE